MPAYGIGAISVAYSGDGVENVASAVREARGTGADVILCTGGMSVDPDDNTPGGIQAKAGQNRRLTVPRCARRHVPAGLLRGRHPSHGSAGCVMYAGATIFDLVLPFVAADVPVTRQQIAALGEGGLCLGCESCHWPACPFGK